MVRASLSLPRWPHSARPENLVLLVAGGMGLATLCDFTYAVPDARFGYTEVRVGFVPAIVASFLTRQIGEKRTRELLLSGRILKADEACRLGLVTLRQMVLALAAAVETPTHGLRVVGVPEIRAAQLNLSPQVTRSA